MNRSELNDLLESLIETVGKETVFMEIIQGLSSDELEFQLKEIVRLYDLEEYV